MAEHSEVAYSWPAAVAIVGVLWMMAGCFVTPWMVTAGALTFVAAFIPCGPIRDWWVSRCVST